MIAMSALYAIAPSPAVAVVGSINVFALYPTLVNHSAKVGPISPFH